MENRQNEEKNRRNEEKHLTFFKTKNIISS